MRDETQGVCVRAARTLEVVLAFGRQSSLHGRRNQIQPDMTHRLKKLLWDPCLLGTCAAVCLGLATVLAGESSAKDQVAKEPASQVVPTNGVGPRIHFESAVYDFGKVVCGQIVKHDFPFTNLGGGTLVISNVHSTCGCTSATNTTKSVEPGKQGVISIEFHTDHFNSAVTKVVTVSSNDTNQPIANLEVKGTVWRPIEVVPPSATFMSQTDSPTNDFRVVRILNKQDQPLVLSVSQISQRTIAAEIRTNQPGKEYELVVKLVPPLGGGNTIGQITIKTSSPQVPVLTVPVFALAQQARK